MTELPRAAERVLSGVWAYRAGAERQAAGRFARLAAALAEQGALAECIALAQRAVDDETRHVGICCAMADAYGGANEPAVAGAEPIGPATLPPRDRLLYEIVAFCCITETLNASLMKVALDRARVGAVRHALRSILKDEVQHARLGWAHLAWARARGETSFVAAALPRMLAGAVQEELFSPAERAVDGAELEAHGELPEAQRLAIFEACAEHVLVPGFEQHGIDTGPMRAWISRRKLGKESFR